jgi:DHA1 family multidrug resistance protein-like MFS transporter
MSRDLIFLALSLFTWGIGESAYFYFQPLYLQELGASPIVIGTILGGVGVAMTIAHIPAGYLADRFGRRALMWTAWGIGVISGWIMAVAKSLPVFTVGILLYGITAFVVSPMNSYATAARGKWSVGRAITVLTAAYNAGAVTGPLLGGFIGNRYGLAKIYLFAACIFLISTCVILLIRCQPIEKSETKVLQGRALNRRFLGYLPVMFLAIFSMYLSQPLSSNYLQNERALSIGNIGGLGSLGSLGAVIFSLGLGSFNTKIGFILGQIAAGLFAVLLWQGTGLSWFAAGYFFLGGFRTAKSMAIAYIGELVSSKNLGLAYGISESVGGFALILAPLLAGFLYEKDPKMIYQVGAGLIVLSLFVSLLYSKGQQVIPVVNTSPKPGTKRH